MFLNDILIYSKTLEEYIQYVCNVFERLIQYNLFINLDKYNFHIQKVSFLGFIIFLKGVVIEPDRIQAILEWPVFRNVYNI